MHPRSTAVTISIIYVFVPALFIDPSIIFLYKEDTSIRVLENKSAVDNLYGKGGPETEGSPRVDPIDNKIVYEDSALYDFSKDILLSKPLVYTTVVENHLKVSNAFMPVNSPEISSGFGHRTPPCKKCSSDHLGVDFVPGNGEPVFAVADGIVTDMGALGGYGNFVEIFHLVSNSEGIVEEWTTVYAHFQDNSFPEDLIIGSAVKAETFIGKVGNTGVSTGPHLHFELIIDGEHVDPLPFLGEHKVFVVSEEEYPDYLFVGEVIKVTETTVSYE
jgi:murein DD-endopeptidase MepM/ murein hydrolase activator NlpD